MNLESLHNSLSRIAARAYHGPEKDALTDAAALIGRLAEIQPMAEVEYLKAGYVRDSETKRLLSPRKLASSLNQFIRAVNGADKEEEE